MSGFSINHDEIMRDLCATGGITVVYSATLTAAFEVWNQLAERDADCRETLIVSIHARRKFLFNYLNSEIFSIEDTKLIETVGVRLSGKTMCADIAYSRSGPIVTIHDIMVYDAGIPPYDPSGESKSVDDGDADEFPPLELCGTQLTMDRIDGGGWRNTRRTEDAATDNVLIEHSPGPMFRCFGMNVPIAALIVVVETRMNSEAPSGVHNKTRSHDPSPMTLGTATHHGFGVRGDVFISLADEKLSAAVRRCSARRPIVTDADGMSLIGTMVAPRFAIWASSETAAAFVLSNAIDDAAKVIIGAEAIGFDDLRLNGGETQAAAIGGFGSPFIPSGNMLRDGRECRLVYSATSGHHAPSSRSDRWQSCDAALTGRRHVVSTLSAQAASGSSNSACPGGIADGKIAFASSGWAGGKAATTLTISPPTARLAPAWIVSDCDRSWALEPCDEAGWS